MDTPLLQPELQAGRGRVAGVERLVQTSYVSNLMTTVESWDDLISFLSSEIQGAKVQGGAQGDIPLPNILNNYIVPGPPQYSQRTSGPNKYVPLQYLTPSYTPGYMSKRILKLNVEKFLAHTWLNSLNEKKEIQSFE